ncbi:ABC transporter ATP-binding protein [Dehalobacterium formicoaceticum]|uniref:ABC transporter ATP-binding protein n=1 Tax=Dehalobacterium formicoaceticum TaxID=51515 RepID=A0ABT1Y3P8_9FIRM|nr:ABC transporter ATP-binding protein [Dehalobacterium formicoaceticum]MCR6545116.1 ABC transporter ATP-binding protein [Dehalobacterium formicoaceticum]
MIQGENISLTLGGKRILQDVNLTLSPGEFAVLLGPNGAGKSTLLKVLSRIQKPTTGKVASKGQIGFLAHRSFLYDRLTAYENLKFYGKLFQVSGLPERIEALLDQVGLSYFSHEPVYTFSRGMVQRLAIARAVLHDPALLFLDEPFTGLDQKGTVILDQVLGEMHRRGKTILMVTHNFEQGMELVNRLLIMKKGQKIFDDPIISRGAKELKGIYLQQVGME